jgi:tRNA-splicing ligase RtcB
MIEKSHFNKISDVLYEIPKSLRQDMRVPARIYTTEEMLDEVMTDRTIDQLINVSTLPGIQKHALVMPDAHEGYGFPIGGVAAMSYPDGVISPGGIGYDINCGVRLLKSQITLREIEPYLDSLSREIFHQVPSGVGRGGELKLSDKDIDKVLRDGAKWVIEQGYGDENDINYIESYGHLDNADPSVVSDHAKKRGKDQVGTLGAGNHFVEVGVVEKIFDETVAKAFGIFQDQVTVLIHTGSRGLGHQVATDHIKVMMQAMEKYDIKVPDRELACAPFSSPEGKDYFSAMAAAANFAWANRQMIMHEVRRAWEKEAGDSAGKLSLLYDVAHNIAKVEEHIIDGKKTKLIIHRKGATRAFGPGHPELTDAYRNVGQPVIIPGSMGTASYVLVGTETSMEQSFGSTCHGAGRRLSRHAAKKQVSAKELKERLKGEGIHIQAGSMKGLAEEAPRAYKDIDNVVDVVHRADIAKKVARLKPIIVIKG